MSMVNPSMKNTTKNITRRKKRKPRVDKNGLTAEQRWASRWMRRNPDFGP